jgi:hypothetical protein
VPVTPAAAGRDREGALVTEPPIVYREAMDDGEAPKPKKRPLGSGGGMGTTLGGILAGLDYQLFRASKPTAELVQAAKPVRGLSGEGGDIVDIDAPLVEPSSGDGDSPAPGRATRKPPSV